MTDSTKSWQQFNYNYLQAALAPIVLKLLRWLGTEATPSITEIEQIAAKAPEINFKIHFERICKNFNLSEFERNLLLMCVGIELDSEFAALCAKVQQVDQPYININFLLKLFGENYNYTLSPEAPLRYWRLIDISHGSSLLLNPLKINERLFHYILGDLNADKDLAHILQLVNNPIDKIDSHLQIAKQITEDWINFPNAKNLPILNLYGSDLPCKQNIAAIMTETLNCWLYQINVQVLPNSPEELRNLQCLLAREAKLNNAFYIVVCDDASHLDAYRCYLIANLAKHLGRCCILATEEPFYYVSYPVINIEATKPTRLEQATIWQTLLADDADKYPILPLVEQYDFNAQQISSICLTLASLPEEDNLDKTNRSIWQLCRRQSRKQLGGIVRIIEAKVSWEDIILPPGQQQTLRQIASHVAQRYKVYQQWGFAAKISRGLGISALFAGPSGTGKTLAAEVLAKELQVDLYHVDLSNIINKYIGETEKNLKRVFDAAEGSGAILVFDEADSLFGKRSEVKDSHDRHANIGVSYLLQRMEAYRGLSILTTNLKSSIDHAFLRRIRFIINFPFPEHMQRMQIWQQAFPEQVPCQNLNFEKLAKLAITGGNIANIALNAAFAAAAANEPVKMQHLSYAAQNEYLKLGKTLSALEIGD